jgi:hypothetical protein
MPALPLDDFIVGHIVKLTLHLQKFLFGKAIAFQVIAAGPIETGAS